VVSGYGRKRKHLSFEYQQQGVSNNSQGAQFDFHHRTGGIWPASVKCPGRLAGRSLVAGITFPLRNWMFSEEMTNICNLSWMKRTDNYLLLFY
jgi:hypothetical protein